MAKNKKQLLFRWAIGDSSTRNDDYSKYFSMAKMSILSFQKYFPNAEFVVTYNGTDYKDYFLTRFDKASPKIDKVSFVNSREFDVPYHFNPEPGVWWKWIPYRINDDAIEISVDYDIICLSKPDCLIEALDTLLEGNKDILVIPDLMPYYCQQVCGDFYDDPILKYKIPINCGFVAYAPNVSFEKDFINVTKEVKFSEQRPLRAYYIPDSTSNKEGQYSHFVDEQGCFNVALYASFCDVNIGLLSRNYCVYGQELISRLHKGLKVELCHFIGNTKSLYYDMELEIFRVIKDDNYRIDIAKYPTYLDYCGIARDAL